MDHNGACADWIGTGPASNTLPTLILEVVIARRPKSKTRLGGADAAIFRRRRTRMLEIATAPRGPRNDAYSVNLDRVL